MVEMLEMTISLRLFLGNESALSRKHIRLPQRSKTFCADALFVMSSGARHLSVFTRKARKEKSNSKRFLHFGRNDRWQSCEQTAKDATVVDHRYRRIAGDTPAPTTLAPLQLG